MAWPVGPLPPAAGSQFSLYQWARQFPDAIREREAIFSGGFRWPAGTRVWENGRVASIVVDPDDGEKLRITCEIWDTATEAWVSPDWIGPNVYRPWETEGKKWWTLYSATHVDFPYLPSSYKVALYPADVCSDGTDYPEPSEPAYAHSLHIDDNGEAYLRVPNDGLLTLNGQTLGDYVGYRFDILRAGASKPEQYGYAWHMRFPPRPNDTTYAWGYNCKVVTATIADPELEEFTLTVGAETTAALPVDAPAADVEAALESLSGIGEDRVRVQGDAGGPYTIVFSTAVADTATTAATGVTIAEPANVLGDVDQTFAASLVGKEVIFTAGIKWHRAAVTAADGHALTFATIGEDPNVNRYFAVVAAGAYWRPQFYSGIAGGTSGFPQFRVELERRVTRSGLTPFWDVGNYWSPATWYATLATTGVKTHDPKTDDVIDYLLPAEIVAISECAADTLENPCNCHLYAPDGSKRDADAFDVDLTTLAENFCTDDADLMFAPWLYWSLRGWQLAIESLAPRFVAPIAYTGASAIPNFVAATWWKYHNPTNTRTVTITSVDASGVAQFSAVAMPQRTPGEGNYASLQCHYALINADGSIADAHTGTLTGTTFTMDAHGTDEAPILGFAEPHPNYPTEGDNGDVGKTLVIAFGWPRKFERMVRYLYPRTIFTPAENDTGAVIPPVEEYPGDWLRNEQPSTTVCEYDEYGNLDDVAQAFVADQAYRYMADVFDGPTGRDGYDDLLYQGIPSPTSDFPRYGKQGTATAGGNFWLEDTDKTWWVSATPMVTHTGTGTAGSDTTTLHDSSLYKLWPTHVANPTPPPSTITEDQLRLSRFWQDGSRFVGMILEVAVSGAGTAEDPYVWERRPITAQDVSDETDPFVTVSPAFSATTFDRPYKIREPGASSRGTILNTFKGRNLIITHANGTSETVAITHSDDNRLYWSTSAGVTAAAGDTYVIDEIEPGSVVHYKPSAAAAHKHGAGFVKPEHATQDTRGENWHLGRMGMLENCPTIVTAYGRLRKRDVLAYELWLEFYNGLNALRWIQFPMSWTSRADDDVPENNVRSGGGTNEGVVFFDSLEEEFQEVRTMAEADWDAATSVHESVGIPHETTHQEYRTDGNSFHANISRGYQYAKLSAPGSCMARRLEGWGYGIATFSWDFSVWEDGEPGTYIETTDGVESRRLVFEYRNAFGPGWRVWGMLDGTGIVTTAPEIRVRVGPTDINQKPAWTPTPFSPTGDTSTLRQATCYIKLSVGMAKFDVPGGLRYVD